MQSTRKNSSKNKLWQLFCSPVAALVFLGFTGATAAWATGTTDIFLEIRERVEHQENFNDKFYGTTPKIGEDRDTYLLSRIRLGLVCQFTEQLSGKVSL
ncbi:MAG: hypothetical protein D3920_11640, partial [Candidatus Electrothrix sp. AW2]|nr:hypothetical protein [Candidatus Electrothrix gigas]